MRHLFLITAVIALLGLGTLVQAITIETVAIGDPGNTADTQVMTNDGTTGYGSVGYEYNIGKYEVTAGQYTEFLNAVANVSDAYGLYNTSMWSNTSGCQIQQTNTSGVFSYSVASDYANRPVNYVSYWDSCRFANWLNNGKGSGSTENGAYTLDGYTGNDGRDIGRNAEATWAVTSEDEWYKAAYYMGGGAYSLYANGTSVAPVAGTDTNYNLAIGHPWDGTINGVLEQNGTKDMTGNIFEWNEAIPVISLNYACRGLRGGSFGYSDSTLPSKNRDDGYPSYESLWVGFRVVQVVPEPSSIIALLGGLTGLIGLRRRKA
jgi:sulfatase modifying factor 1